MSIDSIICTVRLSGLPKGWTPPEDYRGPAKKALFKIDPEDFQTVSDFSELKSAESDIRAMPSSAGASAVTSGTGARDASSSGAPKGASAFQQSVSAAVEGNLRPVVPVLRQPGKRAATRFVKQ